MFKNTVIRGATAAAKGGCCSLRTGVLGYRLGALADSVLGEFTGQQQSHGGLNLPGGDRGPLVIVSESGGLRSDTLENIVHERVHDRHGFAGDTGVRMDLLEHFVNVDSVTLLPLVLLLFLIGLGYVLLSLTGLLCCLSASLGRHD